MGNLSFLAWFLWNHTLKKAWLCCNLMAWSDHCNSVLKHSCKEKGLSGQPSPWTEKTSSQPLVWGACHKHYAGSMACQSRDLNQTEHVRDITEQLRQLRQHFLQLLTQQEMIDIPMERWSCVSPAYLGREPPNSPILQQQLGNRQNHSHVTDDVA